MLRFSFLSLVEAIRLCSCLAEMSIGHNLPLSGKHTAHSVATLGCCCLQETKRRVLYYSRFSLWATAAHFVQAAAVPASQAA